jgi:adenosylcobinamide-GDP ribazoletransferase
LLKFAALASLDAQNLWPAALLMPLAGRVAMVVHMMLLPSVRPGGLGSIFCNPPRAAAVWSAAVLGGVAVAMLHWRGIAIWAACIVVTLLLAAYCRRKIGGATGDTFGAVCEIVEIVPALFLAFSPLPAVR